MVRIYSIDSLGKLGDERAVEPLIWTLQNNKESTWIIENTAKALGELGDSRAISALEETIKNLTYTGDYVAGFREMCKAAIIKIKSASTQPAAR